MGFLFLATTFFYPNTAMAGLLGGTIGLLTVRALKFPDLKQQLYIYNGILVGLYLGSAYQLDIYLIGLIILGGILSVFFTAAIAATLWRLDQLPALSLPFLIVALITGFAAKGYESLSQYHSLVPVSFLSETLDRFFIAMGSILFIPHPIAGFILFLGLFFASRYMAFLAVTGFFVGITIFTALAGTGDSGMIWWNGFNFILTAIALGGVFVVPGIESFLLAMVGSGIAALITAATQTALLVYGLPVMVIPFLLTTLTLLMALRKRTVLSPPYLLLERPGLPDVNFESARLLRARTGAVESIPICSPFLGQWEIYQGFNGKHTHRPPWQHALDFYITDNDRSFKSTGAIREDYYCFGLPVIAPAYSQVVSLRNDLPDNTPGEVDTRNNWGNYVLLRLVSGMYVLLAHLRQGSILVLEGAWVQVGDQIASCGNSGRSPQPHLHLQVQASATLGSATLPFHLVNIISYAQEEREGKFYLALCPEEKIKIAPALPHPKLSNLLHLPIGRTFNYNVSVNGEPYQERELRVEVSLTGQFRLIDNKKASAAFHETYGLLAFYDRQGPRDSFLDLWLLALGLTPLTEDANQWQDAPSARLLPLCVWQRLLIATRYPLGTGLESRYRRHWDEEARLWRQEGTHLLCPLPTLTWQMQTTVDLSPDLGVTRLEGVFGKNCIEAVLRATGTLPDHGIPAVTQPVEGNATSPSIIRTNTSITNNQACK